MTTVDLDIRHYGHEQAADVRPLLLDIYTEVYADRLSDPFFAVDRFAVGLDRWSSRPGWACTIGYAGDLAVGYAYGAPLPEDAAWWGGLLTDVPAADTEETGTRTFALSELMIRPGWRKTGASRTIHDALLATRREERATLLVEQEHPKVRALYEAWGWRWFGDLRPRIPNAPLLDAMLIDLSRR